MPCLRPGGGRAATASRALTVGIVVSRSIDLTSPSGSESCVAVEQSTLRSVDSECAGRGIEIVLLAGVDTVLIRQHRSAAVAERIGPVEVEEHGTYRWDKMVSRLQRCPLPQPRFLGSDPRDDPTTISEALATGFDPKRSGNRGPILRVALADVPNAITAEYQSERGFVSSVTQRRIIFGLQRSRIHP